MLLSGQNLNTTIKFEFPDAEEISFGEDPQSGSLRVEMNTLPIEPQKDIRVAVYTHFDCAYYDIPKSSFEILVII